jgi:hypothetical protein
MTTVERLERGLERIKRGWCQGSYARKSDGTKTVPWSDEACEWCTASSLVMSSYFPEKDDYGPALRLVCDVAKVDYVGNIEHWNDEPGRTKAEVIAVFEGAIELAREEADGE